MMRLLSTMRWDIQLQFRNGFYYAAAFVLAIWAVLISQAGGLRTNLDQWLPILILFNMIINTFFFIGGLVLLEKGEGTLEAQIVTPLRTFEYLLSKVLTLGLLTLIENLLIVFMVHGFRFRVLPLLLGFVLATAIYTLSGFILVARYDSINEYLMPAVLFTILFAVPILPYLGLPQHWLFYLHPLQAPLLLMKAAFLPLGLWQMIYAICYAVGWVLVTGWLAKRAFHLFVISKEGVR